MMTESGHNISLAWQWKCMQESCRKRKSSLSGIRYVYHGRHSISRWIKDSVMKRTVHLAITVHPHVDHVKQCQDKGCYWWKISNRRHYHQHHWFAKLLTPSLQMHLKTDGFVWPCLGCCSYRKSKPVITGNTWSLSSQLTEPPWADRGLNSGISVCKLISTLKKKNVQVGNEVKHSPQILACEEKATTTIIITQLWAEIKLSPLSTLFIFDFLTAWYASGLYLNLTTWMLNR